MQARLISVPYDCGARGAGVGAGPDCLLSSGLADRLGSAGHRVQVETVSLTDMGAVPEASSVFALNRELAARVGASIAAGALPVVLAGNCCSASGTLAGLGSESVGTLWLDAHGDFNTPDTTGSGLLDGMALAIATGRCWKALAAGIPGFRPLPEDRVIMVGVRAQDPPESEALSASAVTVLQPRRVREGLPLALATWSGTVRDAYVHIDVDVLDPSEGRGNRYSAPGGLSLTDVMSVLEAVSAVVRIRALAITAYDPSLDVDRRVCRAATEMIVAVVSRAVAS